MKEVYDFLKESGTYYLATIDEGKPRVRPFGTANVFEGKIYFQTGKAKNVSKQLKANPNIEICAMDSGKWIRISAVAVEDDRIEARESMLNAYPALQTMYQANDGNMQVFYLKDAVATISSFPTTPRVIQF
ncbi:MAG: pyridoxamine 5'-phosphate oxidase family protein [Treponema sp.]|jgi:uncharacterized pyridoxamine 5'-phosphate oxidase family protein|nr:pyridoxamine 5'-phosphate oxidase family protein [Treponema sp.]